MEKMKFNVKMLSMFGMNGAIFGSALPYYHDFYNFKVLTSDMCSGAGLSRFAQKYPDDFINVGIAEQNMIGVAAGLASEGIKCVVVAQACFITMRSFEPVRQFFGYMGNKAILIGINSGFTLTYFGNTHYSIEDLTLMRTIPGMTVLSPADAGEAVKAFEVALEIDGPVYIRLSGTTNMPIIYNEDFELDLTQPKVVENNGDEVTVVATGSMVHYCREAVKSLVEEGVKAKVVDVCSIKPLSTSLVELIKGSKLVVSVEEHNIVGGLGGAVAELMAEEGNMPRLLRIGICDRFSSVGDYKYLLDQHGLTKEKIAESIKVRLWDEI
ncbi:transketolase C-terminal domain-containing protein [Bacteroides uniformis]|uniref:transketolase family protein n=1 Tax=Bacteroides uniformis TaxID=820 RepID=UPI0032C036B2